MVACLSSAAIVSIFNRRAHVDKHFNSNVPTLTAATLSSPSGSDFESKLAALKTVVAMENFRNESSNNAITHNNCNFNQNNLSPIQK